MTRELQFQRKPARSGKAKSLLVFLHGYGADGADLLGLGDPLAPYLPDTAFVAPNAPEPCQGNPFGYQWFGIPRFDGSSEADAKAGVASSMADLNTFLDARLAEEGLGPEALALFGFSQGAMMSLAIAPFREVPIAGVVACSGRLLAPETISKARVKPPILLMHGDQDPVVPYHEMERAAEVLAPAGFDLYTHTMKGTPHGIAPDGLSVAMQFLRERLPG